MACGGDPSLIEEVEALLASDRLAQGNLSQLVSDVAHSFSGLTQETRNKWLVTARGRIGYAFDRFLPYITAGLAAGDITASRPGLPAGSNSNAGWTAGIGLEVGVVSNVSVKAEYLYLNLGDFNCGLNCGLAPTGNVSFDANLFRGGLNVRF